MAKFKAGNNNYRVVVEPARSVFDYGYMQLGAKDSEERAKYIRWAEKVEWDYTNMCRDIKDAIKRHCDDVGSVSIEYDTEYMCEYCGAAWTEDSNECNGGCCSKDAEGLPEDEDA